MKTWLNILLFGVLLAAGLWFYLHRPATRQATTEGLQIDDTENIVTEIRSMARLTTACYYSEITLVKRKANPNVDNTVGKLIASAIGKKGPLMSDELCLVLKGKVRAGYDLSLLSTQALRREGDTLHLRLPQPQVFEVVANPTDCEVFVSEGTWTHEEMRAIQSEAKGRMEAAAREAGILKKARRSGEEQLMALLRSFGFQHVVLER